MYEELRIMDLSSIMGYSLNNIFPRPTQKYISKFSIHCFPVFAIFKQHIVLFRQHIWKIKIFFKIYRVL